MQISASSWRLSIKYILKVNRQEQVSSDNLSVADELLVRMITLHIREKID